MARRVYENFDLLVESADKGIYRARVTASPTGDTAVVTFRLPFEETRLENLLLKLDPGRSGTRRGTLDPRTEAGRELGGGLFEAVFTGDVALAWARSRDAVQTQGGGLRLRLLLDDAPAIAGLPWELLYDQRSNTFLAQSERTPVVRYLDVPHTQRPLRVDGPLHVLVVISAPTDLPELDVEAEWARIQEALEDRVAAGTVVLHRLPEPTLTGLGRWLRGSTAHVLHFVGHGDFDQRREDGVLYFCDRYGRGAPATASMLGPYVYDHDPLRLIVLNACRSASVDTDDPFAGMAQGLIQQSAGAVIAMQFPITDRAAVTFTGEFYGAVADGYPVDQAATYARKALFATHGSEWATPAVFVQSADGMVFDHIEAQPPEEVAAVVGLELAEAEAEPEPEPEPEAEPEAEPEPEAEAEDAGLPPAPVASPHRHVARPPLHLGDPVGSRAEPTGAWSTERTRRPLPPTAHPGPAQPDLLLPDEPDRDAPADDLLPLFDESPTLVDARHHKGRRAPLLVGAGVGALLIGGTVGVLLTQEGPGGGTETTAGSSTSADQPTASSEDPTASSEETSTDGSGGTPSQHEGQTRAAEHVFTATATRMTSAPTIDGNPWEWAGATAYLSDTAVAGHGQPAVDDLGADPSVSTASPGDPTPTTSPSTGPVSGTWRLGWDAEHLYVLAEVVDPTITQTHAGQPAKAWNGDSVSLELGPRLERVSTEALDDADRHVIIGPTEDGGRIVAVNVPAGGVFVAGGHVGGIQAVVVPTAVGYTVEAALPWKDLGSGPPDAGATFVTNLNVSDAIASGEARGNLATMYSSNASRTTNDVSLRHRWWTLELAG